MIAAKNVQFYLNIADINVKFEQLFNLSTPISVGDFIKL